MAALPEKRQSLLFTATHPERNGELAEGLLTDPVSVSVTPPSSTVERIEQRVLFVDRKQKRVVLRQLLKSPEARRILVFTKTKRGASDLSEHLEGSGVSSSAIHGNKSQAARERALKGFRNGEIRVLVATDLAARGIDVDDVTHVINFDLPIEPESYVHRIGRTGRAGAEGIALTFCDPSERGALRAIERLIQRSIEVDEAFAAPASANKAPIRQENRPDHPGQQRPANGEQQFRRRRRRPQGQPPFGAKRRRGPKRRPVSAGR
jgi:ATP-dependent RNA helicase RhlE